MAELPPILTPRQVADHLGWHINTVYIHCVSGDLPSFKAGKSRRIRRELYLDWIAKLEQSS